MNKKSVFLLKVKSTSPALHRNTYIAIKSRPGHLKPYFLHPSIFSIFCMLTFYKLNICVCPRQGSSNLSTRLILVKKSAAKSEAGFFNSPLAAVVNENGRVSHPLCFINGNHFMSPGFSDYITCELMADSLLHYTRFYLTFYLLLISLDHNI